MQKGAIGMVLRSHQKFDLFLDISVAASVLDFDTPKPFTQCREEGISYITSLEARSQNVVYYK